MSSGTNTSLTAKSLLPVARMPSTCQVSSTSTASLGTTQTRTWAAPPSPIGDEALEQHPGRGVHAAAVAEAAGEAVAARHGLELARAQAAAAAHDRHVPGGQQPLEAAVGEAGASRRRPSRRR